MLPHFLPKLYKDYSFPLWNQFNTTSSYSIVYVHWGLVCFPSGTASGRKGGVGWDKRIIPETGQFAQAGGAQVCKHPQQVNSALSVWSLKRALRGLAVPLYRPSVAVSLGAFYLSLFSYNRRREKSFACMFAERPSTAKWRTSRLHQLISTPCSFLFLCSPQEKEGFPSCHSRTKEQWRLWKAPCRLLREKWQNWKIFIERMAHEWAHKRWPNCLRPRGLHLRDSHFLSLTGQTRSIGSETDSWQV